MEASIIFHFAGRGDAGQRLALIDFAQLLDPRWRAPYEEGDKQIVSSSKPFAQSLLVSAYNFVQGGKCLGWTHQFSVCKHLSRHCWSTRGDYGVPH
jgi:hypothetical protein